MKSRYHSVNGCAGILYWEPLGRAEENARPDSVNDNGGSTDRTRSALNELLHAILYGGCCLSETCYLRKWRALRDYVGYEWCVFGPVIAQRDTRTLS
jgi:hypothetical protein